MQWCHNSDFGHFELSIKEDCTFDTNFFDKNVIFVASKLSPRGQFIFCLCSMCTTFNHNFKNISQNGQNQSCDTIALKRRNVQWCKLVETLMCMYLTDIFETNMNVYELHEKADSSTYTGKAKSTKSVGKTLR